MGRPFTGARDFAGRTQRSRAAVKLEAAKDAIIEHLRGLGTPSRVVLIAFNDQAQVIFDGPSDDHQSIAAALGGLEATGGTNLATALRQAVVSVKGAVSERSYRVVVVTDGEDDSSAAAAAAALRGAGALIDVRLIDPTPKGEIVARAIAGDGTVSAVTSADELRDEVGRAKAAHEEQRARADAVVARHEEEREALAKEKPVNERLALTAAYPPNIATERWYPFTVYLHTAALVAEVSALAVKANPGASRPTLALATASHSVARGTMLTLTPVAEGLAFNPPSITIAWIEDVQEVRFRVRAAADRAEQALGGALEVSIASLPIAHLWFAINVRSDAATIPPAPLTSVNAGTYQDVFASYAREDELVVHACRAFYAGLGIHLAVDKQTLRSGQEWDPALRAIIERCDLFHLFWSSAASRSEPVRNEYQFALGQLPAKGNGFIRPVMWEIPEPQIPDDLARFHFAPLDLTTLSALTGLPVSKVPAVSASSSASTRPDNNVPVAAVPLLEGAAPELLRTVRNDLSDAVQFLERTTSLRYYPVPTLLVDEHVVKTVRARETVDLRPVDVAQMELAEALTSYLLAIDLQFHVSALIPGKRGDMPREIFAERFGAGRIMNRERFSWIQHEAEAFPRIDDVLGTEVRKCGRALGALINHPNIDLGFADVINLLIGCGATALDRLDSGEFGRVYTSDWDDDRLPSVAIAAFTGAGGTVRVGRNGQLVGPPQSFAAFLRAVEQLLRPLLSVIEKVDSSRWVTSPPEGKPASALLAAAGGVLSSVLPSSHPLKDLVNPWLNWWVDDLLNPRWQRISRGMAALGLTAAGDLTSLPAVLERFLAIMGSLLDEGLRHGGDFDCQTSFPISEESWRRVAADVGDHGLVVSPREGRGEREVSLAGRFSQLIASYHSVAGRLLSVVSGLRRQRSTTQRVFVEMSPTFGIFAQARSEATDHALYRWAAEQGVSQALTLPGADRVLLCMGAADRFVAKLRESATHAGQARAMGAAFQRCVLVHEHFHALAACALDENGSAAPGAALAESWSKGRALNESLAVWMELHFVRGDTSMKQLVWDYIQAGAYPHWPYAGAARLEVDFTVGGVEPIRNWIRRLRATPELAQADFDAAVANAAPA